MVPPHDRILPDGRLHLQHGPIDLVIETVGDRPEVARAREAAVARFATILPELCGELSLLRSPVRAGPARLDGPVARRMEAAVRPFAEGTFVTPMAAVAGAVADEILGVLTSAADLRRVAVNNGGDIALYLAPGERFRIGLVDRPEAPGLFGSTTIAAEDGIGGIATSGWRGRSFSRGIADAVTVLARSAAEADAAATIVANAVDLPGHPAVTRLPARAVRCDSDLGDIPVTRAVGALARAEVEQALERGLDRARELRVRGLIRGAALHLQGVTAVTRSQSRDAENLFVERPPEALPIVPRADGRRFNGPQGPAIDRNSIVPHAEVLAMGEPRSTHDRRASFEAPLRGAPQDEEVGRSRTGFRHSSGPNWKERAA